MEERTLQEQVTHWQSEAMQLQSECEQLKGKNAEVIRELRRAKQTLELYGNAFGFKVPQRPSNTEQAEPFSQ